MQRLIAVIALSIAFLVLAPDGALHAQNDSVTAVILSPRVGVRLTPLDCSTYRLFTAIPNLESAIFLALPDSSCIVRVRFRPEGSATRDTLIAYSFPSVDRLGERIDHFEDMVEGSYKPGTGHARLRFVRIAGPPPVSAPHAPEHYAMTGMTDLRTLRPAAAGAPPRDLLTFGQPLSASIDEGITYPVIGFGAGAFSYAPDVAQAQGAIDALEAKYRTQGYNLPHWQAASPAPLVTMLSIFYRFSQSVTVLLDAGRAPRDEVTYASASLHYARDIGLGPRLPAFIGAGWIHVSMAVEHLYNVQVSPPERYLYLDAIRIAGGASGAIMTAGIEWRAPSVLNVMLYAQYLALPDLHATIENAQPATITLRSPGVGLKAHLLIY